MDDVRVLIEIVHSLGGDDQPRAVGPLDQLLLNEVPRAELEVLQWDARELLDLAGEETPLFGFTRR